MSNKTDWIISIASSENDGVTIRRFFGSEEDVKELLVCLVREDKENDEISFDNGTESVSDVEFDGLGRFDAYGTYSSYHIDYSAEELFCISVITKEEYARDIVKDIGWDTDGDKEVFDSLPQEIILPKTFSKENYKNEKGIFGKEEEAERLEEISDWISEEYGFCHEGFVLINADESFEVMEELISTNMGDIPKKDYLDIKAQEYGFDDYEDMRKQGYILDR